MKPAELRVRVFKGKEVGLLGSIAYANEVLSASRFSGSVVCSGGFGGGGAGFSFLSVEKGKNITTKHIHTLQPLQIDVGSGLN